MYGISLSWSSVMPAVSTKSNCKCLANSLDQIRDRPSEGDLEVDLFHFSDKNIRNNFYWSFNCFRWVKYTDSSDDDALYDCHCNHFHFWCSCHARCHFVDVDRHAIVDSGQVIPSNRLIFDVPKNYVDYLHSLNQIRCVDDVNDGDVFDVNYVNVQNHAIAHFRCLMFDGFDDVVWFFKKKQKIEWFI